MCGICGFYSKLNHAKDELVDMNNTMIHRGPNDHGEEIYSCVLSEYSVGIAHRRLSIFDLSNLGHQPMHTENKRITIVFNGEIYNFKELREELVDYSFKSNCDTEVIIAAYVKWGIQCVEKFNGMFAIAIYDRLDESLYLIRDRIGKKPLYYFYDNENLYFASELKAIMKNKYFHKQINESVLGMYLYRQYINAPNSIFKDTYKLEPGAILKFNAGRVESWKYWDVSEKHNANKLEISYNEALEMFEELLKSAVKSRMVADVPVGCFLSGGYDSALVCALAQSTSEKPIQTYAIGFEDDRLDEAPYAKMVADHLGTKHTEYYITEKEMFALVDSIPQYYDEPFADSSQICTMLVSEVAKKDVTVVLTGDAGDEMFGGYNVYNTIAKAEEKKAIGRIIHYLYKFPIVEKIHPFIKIPMIYRIASESIDSNVQTQVGSGVYFSKLDNLFLKKEQKEYLFHMEDRYKEKSWVYKRMLLDMETYLPGDILCKVDRASMKYSLESRCPFLDKNIMEFSLRLPLDYKILDGNLKRIIKDVTHKYIPKEIMDRPKQGFGVPRERWLRNELREELLTYTDNKFLLEQGIFDVREVQNYINYFLENGNAGAGKNYGGHIWAYFVFQKWYKNFLCEL